MLDAIGNAARQHVLGGIDRVELDFHPGAVGEGAGRMLLEAMVEGDCQRLIERLPGALRLPPADGGADIVQRMTEDLGPGDIVRCHERDGALAVEGCGLGIARQHAELRQVGIAHGELGRACCLLQHLNSLAAEGIGALAVSGEIAQPRQPAQVVADMPDIAERPIERKRAGLGGDGPFHLAGQVAFEGIALVEAGALRIA